MKKIQKNVYLGLGSNLGNRIKNINQAIVLLSKNNRIKILKKSSFYETEPVGFKNQKWFINCVLKIRTNLSPHELLIESKNIEKILKRKKNLRFGPRTIDVDILMYGNDIIKSKNLTIPHIRMHKRLFVLIPMAEFAGKKLHPVYNKTIMTLLKESKDSSIVKIFTQIPI